MAGQLPWPLERELGVEPGSAEPERAEQELVELEQLEPKPLSQEPLELSEPERPQLAALQPVQQLPPNLPAIRTVPLGRKAPECPRMTGLRPCS